MDLIGNLPVISGVGFGIITILVGVLTAAAVIGVVYLGVKAVTLQQRTQRNKTPALPIIITVLVSVALFIVSVGGTNYVAVSNADAVRANLIHEAAAVYDIDLTQEQAAELLQGGSTSWWLSQHQDSNERLLLGSTWVELSEGENVELVLAWEDEEWVLVNYTVLPEFERMDSR